MQTNPVMEAIGNAKTVRNNNSSRFGKHFDIQFDEKGSILGAFTSSYLLEKPRITEHMKGERNYHIFYEVCAGLKDDQDMALGQGPSSFWYLAQVRGCSIIRVYDSMIRGAA